MFTHEWSALHSVVLISKVTTACGHWHVPIYLTNRKMTFSRSTTMIHLENVQTWSASLKTFVSKSVQSLWLASTIKLTLSQVQSVLALEYIIMIQIRGSTCNSFFRFRLGAIILQNYSAGQWRLRPEAWKIISDDTRSRWLPRSQFYTSFKWTLWALKPVIVEN